MNEHNVLGSKRFWTALLGIVSMILVGIVPELQEHIETLTPGILGIIGLLIGGYSLEDTFQPKPGRGSNSIPSSIKTLQIENTTEHPNTPFSVDTTTYTTRTEPLKKDLEG